MVFIPPILDVVLLATFFFFVSTRPKISIRIGRFLILRWGWRAICTFALIESIRYLYFRRPRPPHRNDNPYLRNLRQIVLLIAIIASGILPPLLQLVTLRFFDWLVISTYCTPSFGSGAAIHHPVAGGMANITDAVVSHISQVSRHTAVTFCNFELAKRRLFDGDTIAAVEHDGWEGYGYQGTRETRKSMVGRCVVVDRESPRPTTFGQSPPAPITGIPQQLHDILTIQIHLAHSHLHSQNALLQVQNLSRLAHTLQTSLSRLPTSPSFWDEDKLLPPAEMSIVPRIYRGWVRGLLEKPVFGWKGGRVWAVWVLGLREHGYRDARRDADAVREGMKDSGAVIVTGWEESCAGAGGLDTKERGEKGADGDEYKLTELLTTYSGRYLFNHPYSSSPPATHLASRAPVEATLLLRKKFPACRAWREAVELVAETDLEVTTSTSSTIANVPVSNSSARAPRLELEQRWNRWRNQECGPLKPLNQRQMEVWNEWRGHLGGEPEGLHRGRR